MWTVGFRSTARHRPWHWAGGLTLLLATAAGPTTRPPATTRSTGRPASGSTTAVARPLDPFPPLPGVGKPRFDAEVDQVCRLARLGLPDRAYLSKLWAAYGAEWATAAAEDDPTVDVLAGLCASEGIGRSADQAEAYRRFDVAVRLGSTAGMVRLGLAYAAGTGVSRDATTAVLLFRRASDAGDMDGTACLAAAYAAGAGVSQSDAEAVRLYRLASDAGNPVAALGLSTAYRLGRGVRETPAAAAAYMQRAVDAGSAQALLAVGDGYAGGTTGFVGDGAIAADWYRRAADLGSPDAMVRLSDLCLSNPPVHSTPASPTSRPTTGGGPDLAGAVAWLRRAAATGDPAALLREGDLLALGLPPIVKVDPQAAMADYRRSAGAGATAAFSRLGYAYEVGWHADRDPATARDLYGRGAADGDPDCMAALAATYDESFKGLEHDPDTEAFWYQRAASEGNLAGMLGLASCYLNGTGVARDPAMAARWYGRAVDAGSPAAMNGMGMANNVPGVDGMGSARNPAVAADWFRRAALAGDGSGMRNLARAYAAGNGVPADGPQAIKIFQLSIRTFQAQGDTRRAAEVMLDLAKVYALQVGVPRDMRLAVDWANRAAAAGEPAAWTFLGNLSDRGSDGVPRDRVAALVAYRKGAAAGDVGSMLAAGALRQQGVGGAIDEREAFAWYSRAAAAGSAEGMDRLGLLYWRGTQAAHNLPVAADWFTQAAEAGSATGAGHLAVMRANGLGGPPDMGAAVLYARRAAAGHHPEFLTVVADALLRGAEGRAPDRTSGEVLLRMAASLGDAGARSMLERLPPRPASGPAGAGVR